MHSVRQSVTAGCTTTLSSHYGTHTHTHTCRSSSQREGEALRDRAAHTDTHTGAHTYTHTLIKTMYLSEKRTLSWDTHSHTDTQSHTEASPCPCTGQPNYLSAPCCSSLLFSPSLTSPPLTPSPSFLSCRPHSSVPTCH